MTHGALEGALSCCCRWVSALEPRVQSTWQCSLTWTEFLYSCVTIETTDTAACEQLKALMDKVVEDREVVLVRRRQGGDVALVAAEELEGLLETAHLLRSPRNAARLLAALERARSGGLPALCFEDLEAGLGK